MHYKTFAFVDTGSISREFMFKRLMSAAWSKYLHYRESIKKKTNENGLDLEECQISSTRWGMEARV